MQKKKCRECRFWLNNESYPTDDSDINNLVLRADCRRFPKYQDRHEDDWCGEFEAKEKENKMNLDQTWKECLKMWKWIAEECNGKMPIAVLKLKYLQDHKMKEIVANCFFCDCVESCGKCPGRLVDAEFDCKNPGYDYQRKPKKFYQELLRLNVIRLERKNKNE